MNSKLKKSFSLRLCTVFCMLLISVATFGQQSRQQIRLNQLGFFPDGPKKAVVLNSEPDIFQLRDTKDNVVFTGRLKKSAAPDFAGNYTRIADFSAFKKPGRYVLFVPGTGRSWPFEIRASVLKKMANASIKAYYFMRASAPLPEKYAGKWHRTEGHPDTAVYIHPSAAGKNRPAGSIISAPGGWYDAGDYNKYIVNSGISTSTLLSLYEDFPAYMKTVDLNLPESGNHIPDILNQVLWNLRWMLKMQDPNDGGVYHKLTNAAFAGFVMPGQATAKRYVVQKSTAATLDFAAVMAQAARIFSKYPKTLPGLADSCLRASEYAWQWARKNPAVIYNQDAMNREFSPQITTGAYGDHHLDDEFIWAASELTITTHDGNFVKNINLMPDDKILLPSWGQVRLLGYYSLVKHSRELGDQCPGAVPGIKRRLLAFADSLTDGMDANAYQTVMDESRRNFIWGSNSVAANEGVALIQAYLISGKTKYLNAALSNLDYILGRNGTGYSFVTSYGSKTPMYPHHRPSFSDGVEAPVPGLMVGGPNPGMQDGVKVPSVVPDEAYIDKTPAYAVNEVAINWNAPLAYLVNAIEALQVKLTP